MISNLASKLTKAKPRLGTSKSPIILQEPMVYEVIQAPGSPIGSTTSGMRQ